MHTPPLDGHVALSHWGVIRAHGADALSFLHSQLTNDIASLQPGQARLAGFCSAKGRLQASFVVWSSAPDEVLLACSASLLPATLKRLSMFVLRAKCKLSDASGELALHGVVGASARVLVGDAAVWATRAGDAGWVMRLPDAAAQQRCLRIAAASDDAPVGPALPLDTWRWLDVQSGLPIIEASTVDRFVPQMLNYELVGGVDFKKGCYPGQEIVARSQYRGTIKRRMFLFDIDASATAGQEIFHSADAVQPAGMVVNAAPRPDGVGAAALVEVKLAAFDGGSLHLGDASGPLLHLRELPYAVPNDATQAA